MIFLSNRESFQGISQYYRLSQSWKGRPTFPYKNYRSTSLLHLLRKTFEKVFLTVCVEFQNKHNLLLLILLETRNVFLYPSKVFYYIHHTWLLNNIGYYIRDTRREPSGRLNRVLVIGHSLLEFQTSDRRRKAWIMGLSKFHTQQSIALFYLR